MKVLVIGTGGREHALCYALKSSSEVTCIPGNPGIAEEVKCITNISADDISGIVSFAEKEKIELVVVGPEAVLSLGLADELAKKNIPVFGPTKAAAKLETSKRFAKEIMVKAGVPTAKYAEFDSLEAAQKYVRSNSFPLVLKADGLAAGKGVVVCQSLNEAEDALPELFKIPETGGTKCRLIIEEFLTGVEVSFIVATDGERVIPLSTAHDYKRIFDNDQGPNTGGMGTVSPSPRIDIQRTNELIETIISPTLEEMRARGTPFCGFLYAGLMIQPDGKPKVIEFNCRMGDPEGQVLLPRFSGDFASVLLALATKQKLPEIKFSNEHLVCVVLASAGYPTSPVKGDEITGIEFAQNLPKIKVFHAGTKKDQSGKLLTNGGRVLNVVGSGETLSKARENAYRAVDMIQFKGRQVRRDIGIS